MPPELHRDPRFDHAMVGTLVYLGHEVTLHIEPDDVTLEECMASAALAIASLAEVDRLARAVAVSELLSDYNDNWRHYSRADENGDTTEVSDPELEPSAFSERLTLTGLEALGADGYSLCYSDDHMFAGHAIFVHSFDGIYFKDASAELFG